MEKISRECVRVDLALQKSLNCHRVMAGGGGWAPPVLALWRYGAEGSGRISLMLPEMGECQGSGGMRHGVRMSEMVQFQRPCCPAGTHQHRCPVVSVRCAGCEGAGGLRWSGNPRLKCHSRHQPQRDGPQTIYRTVFSSAIGWSCTISNARADCDWICCQIDCVLAAI